MFSYDQFVYYQVVFPRKRAMMLIAECAAKRQKYEFRSICANRAFGILAAVGAGGVG